MSRIKRIAAPAILVILFGVLFIQLPVALADRSSEYVWFNPIIDVRRVLVDRFAEPVDEDAMQRAIIEAIVNSLDDPYTTYVPPQDEDAFERQLMGTYVGIGAEVNMTDGHLTIVSPLPDSPALEAGMLPGDVVLEIEGESTYGMTIEECIELLVGEEGTDVTVRVRHRDGEEAELTITRRRIVSRTVRGLQRIDEDWDYWLDPDNRIAYVRLTQFTDNSAGELERTMQRLHGMGLEGLILDLRNNPGGSLDAAIQVADLFLDDGEIVSVKNRGQKERSTRARSRNTLPDSPMLVLVNQTSASASEVVSGALRDNSRARVLGMRTFGKASVQEVRPLPDGAGTLRYTAGYYYLPSGRNLHRRPDSETWGVDPDPGLVIPVEDEDFITMMRNRRPYEIMGQTEGEEASWNDPEWLENELGDVQLARALEAMRLRLAGEDWPHFTDTEPGVSTVTTELEQYSDRRQQLLEQVEHVEEKIRSLQDLPEAAAGRMIDADHSLEDGTMTVRDANGKVVGEFRIVDGDVEMALRSLRLQRLDDKGTDEKDKASPDKSPSSSPDDEQ